MLLCTHPHCPPVIHNWLLVHSRKKSCALSPDYDVADVVFVSSPLLPDSKDSNGRCHVGQSWLPINRHEPACASGESPTRQHPAGLMGCMILKLHKVLPGNDANPGWWLWACLLPQPLPTTQPQHSNIHIRRFGAKYSKQMDFPGCVSKQRAHLRLAPLQTTMRRTLTAARCLPLAGEPCRPTLAPEASIFRISQSSIEWLAVPPATLRHNSPE